MRPLAWFLFYAVLSVVAVLRLMEFVGDIAGHKAEAILDHDFWFERHMTEGEG